MTWRSLLLLALLAALAHPGLAQEASTPIPAQQQTDLDAARELFEAGRTDEARAAAEDLLYNNDLDFRIENQVIDLLDRIENGDVATGAPPPEPDREPTQESGEWDGLGDLDELDELDALAGLDDLDGLDELERLEASGELDDWDAPEQPVAAAREVPAPAPAPVRKPAPRFPSNRFAVIWAPEGSGFRNGKTGWLHFDPPAVSFVPEGSRKVEWSVPWSRVAELTAATGLWDSRHPLALYQTDDAARYVTPVSEDGRPVEPDRLLAAFARAHDAACGRGAAR
jgi:hypothetical protein